MPSCVKAARTRMDSARVGLHNLGFLSFFNATRFARSCFLATQDAGRFIMPIDFADCELNALVPARMGSLPDDWAARWARQMEASELFEPCVREETRCCSRTA